MAVNFIQNKTIIKVNYDKSSKICINNDISDPYSSKKYLYASP